MNVIEQKLKISTDFKFKENPFFTRLLDISPVDVKSICFIEVILSQTDHVKMNVYYYLDELIQNHSSEDVVYYFIDIELHGNKTRTLFIDIDDYYKTIRFYRDPDLKNNWKVYFNSKTDIVVKDALFKDGYKRLWNNYQYYGDVEFFVGFASLIEVIRNTNYQEFTELNPKLKEEGIRLKNVIPFYIGEDDFKYSSKEQIEKNYFNSIVGLENIKKEIEALKSLASIRSKKMKRNIPVSPTTLHMVFTGNPGTGKTTVARLIGEIYRDIGLLKSGHVVEVTSGELEGKYVGHSAPQTKEYFEKAIDGVLFIDEAYALLKSGNNFGKEVINMLVTLMENNRDKIVVIIAGYTSEMNKLLDSNLGFRERFSTFFEFDDFSKAELNEIFAKMIADIGHKTTDGLKFKFEYLVDEYYDKGAFKSNARSVRNLFETIQKNQSIRLSKIMNPTDEELITFIESDLPDNL